jgi:hypothetical protein
MSGSIFKRRIYKDHNIKHQILYISSTILKSDMVSRLQSVVVPKGRLTERSDSHHRIESLPREPSGLLQGHNSPIMWSTRKQKITANSTTVAEWGALDQPCRDKMWLNKVAGSP